MPVTSAFNHSAVNLGSTVTQTKEEEKNKQKTNEKYHSQKQNISWTWWRVEGHIGCR